MINKERELYNNENDFYDLMKSESEVTSEIEEQYQDISDEDDYLSMMKIMSEEESENIVYGASNDTNNNSNSNSSFNNNSVSGGTKTNSDGTIDTNNVQDVYSSSESNGNVDETNSDVKMGTEEQDTGNHRGLDVNMNMNKGIAYPIIRINDHYCVYEEIVEFYIESGFYKDYREYMSIGKPSTGFVPTLHLILRTSSPDLLKSNQIKSGDKCAVFFRSGGGLIKSYRGDYIITSVVTSDKYSEVTDVKVTYIIRGELYVPNLRNESDKFNFNGSSRDAIVDASERLGLSFFFCDPDNTNDYQGWQCTTNLKDYIQDIATHAWKEFNAFYDCWIDTRYGLSFLNMNKLLIEDGFDEQVDLTPFVSTITAGAGVDGKKAYKSEEKVNKEVQPMAKMFTNIPQDTESATPFYIKKWKIKNRAAEICHSIGINATQTLNIDNAGVESDLNNVDMQYSIPINNTKLQNGFFVLIGPGVNMTYTQADQVAPNQSFVKNSYKVDSGGIVEVMSDGDSEQMKQTGNNMLSSGNTNKFYDTAFEHNMRNNLQLQKQITEIELQGLNLAIMRGEKIPVMIVDNDKLNSSLRAGNYTMSDIEYSMYEMASGWYIIDGIKWNWTPKSNSNGTTFWSTEVKLVRREWPIPGKSKSLTTGDTVNLMNTINPNSAENLQQASTMSAVQKTGSNLNGGTGTGVTPNSRNTNNQNPAEPNNRTNSQPGTMPGTNSTPNPSSSSYSGRVTGTSAKTEIKASAEDDSGTDMPLTGLKPELKTVYRALKAICPNINLVSARRWAVDENGNRVDGNAFVKKNGLYKCCNAKGQIMFFKENNSRHLYGEAIDIINKQGQDFNAIVTTIMNDQTFLGVMADNGCALCIEQTSDDCGAKTKHYHIGTDADIQETWWDSVRAYIPQMSDMLKHKIKNASQSSFRIRSTENKTTDIEDTA